MSRTFVEAVKEIDGNVVSWKLHFGTSLQLIQKWRSAGDNRSHDQLLTFLRHSSSGSREEERGLVPTSNDVQPTASQTRSGLREDENVLVPVSSDVAAVPVQRWAALERVYHAESAAIRGAYHEKQAASDVLKHANSEGAKTTGARNTASSSEESGDRDKFIAQVSKFPSEDEELSCEPGAFQKREAPGSAVCRSGGHEKSFSWVGMTTNDEPNVMEAHNFKIFHVDDDEYRKPAIILKLPSSCRKASLCEKTSTQQLQLTGFADNGLLPFMRTIDLWTIDFQNGPKPALFVREVHGSWIRLLKPSNGYESTIKSALYISDFFDLAIRKSGISVSNAWYFLLKGKSSEKTAMQKALRIHSVFINKFAQRHPLLKNAPIIQHMCMSLKEGSAGQLYKESSEKRKEGKVPAKKSFLGNKRKWAESDEDVDEDDTFSQRRHLIMRKLSGARSEKIKYAKVVMESEYDEDEFSDPVFHVSSADDDGQSDEEDLGDLAFCAICDDGGDVLCCDGPCMRSFHAHKGAVDEVANCTTLGYTAEDVKEMGNWLCANCTYKLHQCFICGELGSSDETLGSSREVFVCDVALCGRFYHPRCLAKRMSVPAGEREEFMAAIENGVETFCCPLHKCEKCGQGELEEKDGQLAKCRRCPIAWHKQCLPCDVAFEEIDGKPQRAWELNKQLLIYCLAHDIIPRLSTPSRNHLKWPSSSQQEQNVEPSGEISEIQHVHVRQTFSAEPCKTIDIEENNEPVAIAVCSPHVSEKNENMKRKLPPRISLPKLKKEKVSVHKEGHQKRVSAIMQAAAQEVSIESIKESLMTTVCYRETIQRKLIQSGEMQSILNAAKKALEKLNSGGTLEDAKRVCPKESLLLLMKNEESMKVYLAPIIHEKRYTSFGRHFTKVEKLQEVVDRIHFYVEDGDMVVDFCCGANDFSSLLSKRLASNGKNCFFKNFDIHPPNNDFCFQKGDWMKVTGKGFLPGSKLIMGLNPPFGVKAALANKFILHALKFKPKLLVLIVPPETMRSSEQFKDFGYELIWEDKDLMKGHSFYLPGTVDTNDKENIGQWNNTTPPLFLWSRGDMVQKHKEIYFQSQSAKVIDPDVTSHLDLPSSEAVLVHPEDTGYCQSRTDIDPLPSSVALAQADIKQKPGASEQLRSVASDPEEGEYSIPPYQSTVLKDDVIEGKNKGDSCHRLASLLKSASKKSSPGTGDNVSDCKEKSTKLQTKSQAHVRRSHDTTRVISPEGDPPETKRREKFTKHKNVATTPESSKINYRTSTNVHHRGDNSSHLPPTFRQGPVIDRVFSRQISQPQTPSVSPRYQTVNNPQFWPAKEHGQSQRQQIVVSEPKWVSVQQRSWAPGPVPMPGGRAQPRAPWAHGDSNIMGYPDRGMMARDHDLPGEHGRPRLSAPRSGGYPTYSGGRYPSNSGSGGWIED